MVGKNSKEINFEEAKEMYFYYNCNRFFMAREDKSVLKKYEAFHVPQELETAWTKERQNKLMLDYENSNDIPTRALCLENILSLEDSGNPEMFYKVLDLFEAQLWTFDSFAQLNIVWSIADFVRKFDKDTIQKLSLRIYRMIKQILAKPIYISEAYTQDENWTSDYTPEIIYDKLEMTLRAVGSGAYFTHQ